MFIDIHMYVWIRFPSSLYKQNTMAKDVHAYIHTMYEHKKNARFFYIYEELKIYKYINSC